MLNSDSQNQISSTDPKKCVDWFVERFGDDNYRDLAMHAALPLVITPELLHYIRNRFLPYVPWIAEVDLLLSELCEPVGSEEYKMQSNIRNFLIFELDNYFGIDRKTLVARILVDYFSEKPSKYFLEASRWSALVYIDDGKSIVVKEITSKFATALERIKNTLGTEGVYESQLINAEITQFTQLIKQFSVDILELGSLINYAHQVGDYLITKGIINFKKKLLESDNLHQHIQLNGIELPDLYKVSEDQSDNILPLILEGNQKTIFRMAWSPDGTKLAVPSVEGKISIWQWPSGNLLHSIQVSQHGINQVAWSPDGLKLAAACFDHLVRIWELNIDGKPSNNEPTVFKDQSSDIRGITWSKDNLLAICSENGHVRIWQTDDLKLLSSMHSSTNVKLTNIAWSNDGVDLAFGGDNGSVEIIHKNDIRQLFVLDSKPNNVVTSLAWSPKRNLLAVGYNTGEVIILTPRIDGVSPLRLNRSSDSFNLKAHDKHVNALAFSYDEQLLATKSMDGTVRIWRCDTWQLVNEIDEPSANFFLSGLGWHPLEHILATLTDYDTKVRLWNVDINRLSSISSDTLIITDIINQQDQIKPPLRIYVDSDKDFPEYDKLRYALVNTGSAVYIDIDELESCELLILIGIQSSLESACMQFAKRRGIPIHKFIDFEHGSQLQDNSVTIYYKPNDIVNVIVDTLFKQSSDGSTSKLLSDVLAYRSYCDSEAIAKKQLSEEIENRINDMLTGWPLQARNLSYSMMQNVCGVLNKTGDNLLLGELNTLLNNIDRLKLSMNRQLLNEIVGVANDVYYPDADNILKELYPNEAGVYELPRDVPIIVSLVAYEVYYTERRNLQSFDRIRKYWEKLLGVARNQLIELSGNGLTSLPESIRDNAASLLVLDLSNNLLTDLPEWLSEFTALEKINLYHNRFTKFPLILLKLTNIHLIDLAGNLDGSEPGHELHTNQISEIPDGIGCLSYLSELRLGSNVLSDLPDGMANLSNLNTLYLDRNRFERIPNVVYSLRRLRRLTIGGVGFSEIEPTFTNLEDLEFFDVAPARITDDEVIHLATHGDPSERPAILRNYFNNKSLKTPITFPIRPPNNMLYPILGKENNNRVADIVFVHGINPLGELNRDHAFKPWGDNNSDFWPKWLGEDLAADGLSVGIWVLEYDAAVLGWTGHAMPLSDRAASIIDAFYGEGIGNRPLAFVAHSLGGLVVKQVLHRSATSGKTTERSIAINTKAVVFMATPHTGANIATFITNLGKSLNQTEAIKDLAKNQAPLREQADWYLNKSLEMGILTRSYYETRPDHGILIVDQESANPHIRGSANIPVDANHSEICKISSRDIPQYKSIHRFLIEAFNSQRTAGEVPQSESSQITADKSLLLNILSKLPAAQFDMLVELLCPPAGIISPNHSPQLSRTIEILQWEQSPSGKGLHHLADTLNSILNPR